PFDMLLYVAWNMPPLTRRERANRVKKRNVFTSYGPVARQVIDALIDKYAEGEAAGYPTLCKGRFMVDGQRMHALEEPTSLNTIELIPELVTMGVAAVKIEGRQRSPAYVEQVTRVWRAALDAYQKAPQQFSVAPDWRDALAAVSEGSQTTLGAYHRAWQ
ncbi:MAG: U32 family peptidase, partial [Pseudomonadaceae bacterium]|nr:U32 family peptidase [Pseudomonadaceae bacterium]